MVGSCARKTSVGRHSRPIGGPTIGRHVDRLSVDMSAESVDRQRSLLHMILVFKMTSLHCFVKWLSNFLLPLINFY